MGLPYAQDAGVTRHLAAFLCRQSNAAQDFFGAAQGFIKPTAVLFNGGVLKAPKLAQRLMSVLNSWLQQFFQCKLATAKLLQKVANWQDYKQFLPEI